MDPCSAHHASELDSSALGHTYAGGRLLRLTRAGGLRAVRVSLAFSDTKPKVVGRFRGLGVRALRLARALVTSEDARHLHHELPTLVT